MIDHDYHAHSGPEDTARWDSLKAGTRPTMMAPALGALYDVDEYMRWRAADIYVTRLYRYALRQSRQQKPGKYRHLLCR